MGNFVIDMLWYAIKLSIQVSLLVAVLRMIWSSYGQILIKHALTSFLHLILQSIRSESTQSILTSMLGAGDAQMLHADLEQFFRYGNMSSQINDQQAASASQPLHEHAGTWHAHYADILSTVVPVAIPVVLRSLRRAMM